MATLTAAAAAASFVPAYNEKGKFSRAFSYSSSATVSAADVILMGKVPSGVTVVDGYVSVTSGGDAVAASVGIDGSLSAFFASATLAGDTVNRFAKGIPYTVSVSDDATTRYELLKVAVDGDITTSFTIKLVVDFAADLN